MCIWNTLWRVHLQYVTVTGVCASWKQDGFGCPEKQAAVIALLPVSRALGSKYRSVSQSSGTFVCSRPLNRPRIRKHWHFTSVPRLFTSHNHMYAFSNEMCCSPLPNSNSSHFFPLNSALWHCRRRCCHMPQCLKYHTCGREQTAQKPWSPFQQQMYYSLIFPVGQSVGHKASVAFSSGPFKALTFDDFNFTVSLSFSGTQDRSPWHHVSRGTRGTEKQLISRL